MNINYKLDYCSGKTKPVNANPPCNEVSEKTQQCTHWFYLCFLLIFKSLIILAFYHAPLNGYFNITWKI